jgi:predicted nucleic acid-binding protein
VNRILIDTNIYSFALRGASEVVSVLQKATEIGICAISIGELLSGFKGGGRDRENRAELEEFLDAPRVRLYPIDETTADYYAEILDELRRLGKPIPTNDIWIGAVALQHGLKLFSKDKHFENIPGIIVLS